MFRRMLCLGGLLAVATLGTVATAQAEPHWYKNGVVLPEEAGTTNTEGTPVISWGNLILETKTVGLMVCSNAFGAQVFNPIGGGAGEGKVESFAVWNCTSEECEVVLKSKLEIRPEGLTKFGFWESKLFEEAGVQRLRVGNKTAGDPHQIKFLILCEGIERINTPTRGELTPKVKNGHALSAPSKVEFGEGSGELELAGVKEGKVFGSLKIMGYVGNEIINVQNP